MDVLARKLNIIERITQTESEVILEQVDALLNREPLSQEHQKILDERLAAYQADPASGSSWQDAKKRIEKSLAK